MYVQIDRRVFGVHRYHHVLSLCVAQHDRVHIDSKQIDPGRRLLRVRQPNTAGRQELAEMRQNVEGRLSIVFGRRRIHDDRSIDKVLAPVGTSLQVQRQVPVYPSGCPVVQIFYDVEGVILSSTPIAQVYV